MLFFLRTTSSIKYTSYFSCSSVVKLDEMTAVDVGVFSPCFMVAPVAPLKREITRSLIAPLYLGSSTASGR